MKNNKLKNNLRFEKSGDGVVFNHFSFCETVKHIMVKYGHITYENAEEKLNDSFLIEAPKSLDDVCYITHELEFHWAMLTIHGNMYWIKGIPSDFNDFEEEYLNWQDQIRMKYKLKESYKYYDIKSDK